MLRGKHALVTGGTRGIGFAIAKKLTALGVNTVITGRSAAALEEAAAKLPPELIHTIVHDTTKIDGDEEIILETVRLTGGFDILVNNAGILLREHEWGISVLNQVEADWDSVMDTNLKAYFFMMKAAVKYMYGNKIRGNVLNISSVAGYEPVSGPYGASKAGVLGLTRGWGKIFAPYGIVVNGIAPGPVATDMNKWKEGDSMENIRVPSGRYAISEEIAELAAFLLSEEANMIVGTTVTEDGAYAVR